MNRLERVRRISAVLRYLLLGCAVVLGVALIATLWAPDRDWVRIGDGQLVALWHAGHISLSTLRLALAPIIAMLALGVYWLQRLFGEYQAGHFFTPGTMRCYLWLVWLKAAAFVYQLAWPLLWLNQSSPRPAITIDAGTIVELLVLLLIVHLLREAQRINEENEAFV